MEGALNKRAIVLVRHGERIDDVEVDWIQNAERPFDPPLTENGAVQAFKTGVVLMNEGIKHVFSSPFLRCVQTAYHILSGIQSAQPEVSSAVPSSMIKIDTGLAEYMSSHNFASPPPYYDAKQLKHVLPEVPTDETHHSLVSPTYPEEERDMRMRCARAIEGLLSQCPDGNILVVTHGSPVSAILQALTELYLPPAEVPYSSITRITGEGRTWRAEAIAQAIHWRDTKHPVE